MPNEALSGEILSSLTPRTSLLTVSQTPPTPSTIIEANPLLIAAKDYLSINKSHFLKKHTI